MSDSVASINRWQALARPTPSDRDLTIGFAVWLEECVETIDALKLGRRGTYARQAMHEWCEELKQGRDSVVIDDRKALCDGLADVIVTAVGVGHCAKMDVPRALDIVNESNFSKFLADGTPLRNDQGKIIKNPLTYKAPDLTGCY